MRNIVLLLAYDGTHYLGWQATPTGPSVEETLKKVLEQILQEPVHLQAASRTDAGVHAWGQVVNFTTTHMHLELSRLHKSLNSLLPKDLSILEVREEPPSFHPTLDCIGKEYHYFICNGIAQLPLNRFYSWHYAYPLDLDKMIGAAQLLVGENDFSAFCNSRKDSQYEHKTRSVHKIEISALQPDRLRVVVAGNNFLYKMVRNLVGTLVYVGRDKISADQLPAILAGKDRTLAGITAPAHGLHLANIFY